MDKFHAFMMRYTLGVGRLLQAYCKWAEAQAKNQLDLLCWASARSSPWAFCCGAAGVDRQAHRLRLSLPALYIIFLVLRAYAIRGAGADEGPADS
jgi:hypothetical protein